MVIQRWQSLFLLLSCILMGLFSFFSLGQIQAPDFSLNITALGLCYEGEATGSGPSGCYMGTIYFFILSIMSAILPLISIFLYKNLPLQRKVCMVEVLFIIATIATGCYVNYTAVAGCTPQWSSLVIAPFLALILDIMAWYRIRKDHKLLRSADRLR